MCWSRLDRGATVLMGLANSLLLQVTEGAKDVRRASSKTQQANSGQTPQNPRARTLQLQSFKEQQRGGKCGGAAGPREGQDVPTGMQPVDGRALQWTIVQPQNKVLTPAMTWPSMILEDMVLLESSQREKATYGMIPRVRTVQYVQIHTERKQPAGCLGQRGRQVGLEATAKGARFSLR